MVIGENIGSRFGDRIVEGASGQESTVRFMRDKLSGAYRARGDLDLTIQGWKESAEHHPDSEPLQNRLMAAYKANEDWESAIAISMELVAKKPSYIDIRSTFEKFLNQNCNENLTIECWSALLIRFPRE